MTIVNPLPCNAPTVRPIPEQLLKSRLDLRKVQEEQKQKRIDAIPQMSNRQLLEEIYKMLLEQNYR